MESDDNHKRQYGTMVLQESQVTSVSFSWLSFGQMKRPLRIQSSNEQIFKIKFVYYR